VIIQGTQVGITSQRNKWVNLDPGHTGGGVLQISSILKKNFNSICENRGAENIVSLYILKSENFLKAENNLSSPILRLRYLSLELSVLHLYIYFSNRPPNSWFIFTSCVKNFKNKTV
jgi:hypothetical protein